MYRSSRISDNFPTAPDAEFNWNLSSAGDSEKSGNLTERICQVDTNNVTDINPCHHHRPRINYHEVGEAYYPILFPMKYVGLCPLEITRRGRHFAGSSFRIQFLTATQSVIIFTFVCIYTLNKSFDIDWPVRIFESIQFDNLPGSDDTNLDSEFVTSPPKFFILVSTSIQIVVPISAMISGHLGFINMASFIRYLNRWVKFLKMYDVLFSPYYGINLTVKQSRQRYFKFCLIPLCIFGFLLAPLLSNTGFMQISEGNFYVRLWTIVSLQMMVAIRVFNNVKDCFNFSVLRIMYRELRLGIQAQYDSLQGVGVGVTTNHVRKWLKMVVFIRSQRELIETHMKPQNLWLLMEIFSCALLVLTSSILLFMRGPDSVSSSYLTLVTWSVGFVVCIIALLFFKSQMAEDITEEEDKLLDSIVGMDGGDDCKARLEMKSLCDLLFHDPIKIRFGQAVVLNKRLTLSFCSQLATYLVILLQFVKN